MHILHRSDSARKGLLIQGNYGKHLYLRGGGNNDLFISSGGDQVDGEDAGTFLVYGNGDVRCNDFTGVSFTPTSDARLKENIVNLDSDESLTQILELNPVSFHWKENKKPEKTLGLIAQEVEAILPQVVNKKDPEKLALDYMGIIPVLISAVQKLQSEIKDLKNEMK